MLVDEGIITCFKDSSCSHVWNRVKTLTVIHGGGILPTRKRSSMETEFNLWEHCHPWRRHFTYEEMVIHGGGFLPMRKLSSMKAAFYLYGNGHPWRRHFTYEETVIHGGGILPMRKQSSMEAVFYLWVNWSSKEAIFYPWGNGHPWRQHFTYEETVITGGGILPMRKWSSIEAAFYL